jgi:acyl-CoA thioester hydrolase
MPDPAESSISVRVYYEDTDAGGIVYYANYLKFCERGRTEFLRDRGLSNSAIRDEHGLIFVVRDVHCNYLKPAVLDDVLTVHTGIEKTGRSSLVMKQRATRDSLAIFDAIITLVCVDLGGRPRPIPDDVRHRLFGAPA